MSIPSTEPLNPDPDTVEPDVTPSLDPDPAVAPDLPPDTRYAPA